MPSPTTATPATAPRVRRSAVLLLALLTPVAAASGCASSTPAVEQAGIRTVAGEVDLLDDPYLKVVAGDRLRVWREVVDAHRALGFESGDADPETGVVQVIRVLGGGELAGEPLSAFLRCGADFTGREAVDASRVELTVLTRVRDAGERWIELRTRVGGMAQPPGATGSSWRLCRSTGELERRILTEVRGFDVVAEGTEDDMEIMDRTAAQDAGLVAADPSAAGAAAPSEPEEIRTVSPAILAAVDSLERGQRVRLVLPWEWAAGRILELHPDALEMRVGMRQREVPLWIIEELQVRRERRSWALPAGIAGALVGGVLARTTGLGISGDKAEQGDALNPFLGAVGGSLIGAALGSLVGGDYWETIGRVEEGGPVGDGS